MGDGSWELGDEGVNLRIIKRDVPNLMYLEIDLCLMALPPLPAPRAPLSKLIIYFTAKNSALLSQNSR